ncbi:hypothetical protein ACIPRL_08135 [Streptomyces sp. NPDC090085]|uniref:hypothetical protein n=1 Tax=Streptomyces sp. NPDC090085 TaxID=3365943 RepID=UPI00381BC300
MRHNGPIRGALRALSYKRRAHPDTPGPYDTITRLPSHTAQDQAPADRPPRPIWSLPDDEEIRVRCALLLLRGELPAGGIA